MNSSPPAVLPSRYYLDHFLEMVGFVSSKYGHALAPGHRSFLDDFGELAEDARCLYVRIANRRGGVFRREHLRYPEIERPGDAAAELLERRFVRLPDKRDFADLLALEPRTRLLARFRGGAADRVSEAPRVSSLKKDGLLHLALETLAFDAEYPAAEREEYLVQLRTEEVAYLFFLYFGSVHRDLTTSALRDLGRVRTAPFRSDFEPRFTSGEAARACFFYSRLRAVLESASAPETLRLFAGVGEWPVCDDAEAGNLRHRALHRLGRLLERDGRPDEALAVYGLSDQYPATERSVRLLFAGNRLGEAEALLRRLIDDPSCDGELLFAEDFLERKFHKKKTGRLTDLLRAAPVLALDESGRDRPEAAAVARMHRDGLESAHVENRIWLQLFGLLFWDLLFGAELSALHDPFDFTPQDLASGTFLGRHRVIVGERFARLDDPAATVAALDSTWEAQSGKPNSLVSWEGALYALTRRLVLSAPRGALAPVLSEIARDFRTNRSGFPDLVVFDRKQVRFLEIKTEGDQIRRQQLVQIERLRRAGFEVGVANIRWTVDPGQDYVVVDLETTGGDPTRHRITEIGAVRVRDGRVVGEWSSLVNPERRIPSFIAKLTGISDGMVATAPRFAEIAGSFRSFLGDAVFVAHRAKFDHGFLKAEFERLGERFGGPVFCTVAEMKRHFPGLPSYGLGSLCTQFGIPLESHHRALCDARATADLLLRINERRMAALRTEREETQKND